LIVFLLFLFSKRNTHEHLKLTNRFHKTSTLVMLSNTATQAKSYYNLSILQKPSFSTLDTPIQTFSGLKRNIMFSGLFLCSVKS